MFAETCVFGKQSPLPLHCDHLRLQLFSLHHKWHPFSRSYGAILPSSLASILPSALGCSPRPRVSVCGTGTFIIHLEVFLASMGSATSTARRQPPSTPQLIRRICLPDSSPTCRYVLNHQNANLPYWYTPSLKHYKGGTGILTRFPSDSPLGLSLGPD